MTVQYHFQAMDSQREEFEAWWESRCPNGESLKAVAWSAWKGAATPVVAQEGASLAVQAVFEAAVIAHGALFAVMKESRPDRPALEALWLAVDAALAAPPVVLADALEARHADQA